MPDAVRFDQAPNRRPNMPGMTKLLEESVARARELPADVQDAAADALFAHLANEDRRHRLEPDQVEEVKLIRSRLESGQTRLATDEEMYAFGQKHGV
jgi:hypothetical protein